MNQSNRFVYLKLTLVAFMWGGTFIATRMASQAMGAFTGAAMRYCFALVFMIPLLYIQDRQAFKINRKQFLQLLLLGTSGIFVYSYFFFNGLRHVQASHGALIVALNPAMVMLLAAMMGKEHLNGLKILGIGLCLAGVIVVISRGMPHHLFDMFTWGDAFMLGCPVSWAIYTYSAQFSLKTTQPLQASTWAIMLGLLMILFFIPGEPMPVHIEWNIWLALFYLGFCGSFLGFVWYYQGIKAIGAVKTSVFNNLIPVFAMLQSVVMLGETIHGYTLAGSVLVIGGVYLVNRR